MRVAHPVQAQAREVGHLQRAASAGAGLGQRHDAVGCLCQGFELRDAHHVSGVEFTHSVVEQRQGVFTGHGVLAGQTKLHAHGGVVGSGGVGHGLVALGAVGFGQHAVEGVHNALQFGRGGDAGARDGCAGQSAVDGRDVAGTHTRHTCQRVIHQAGRRVDQRRVGIGLQQRERGFGGHVGADGVGHQFLQLF